VKYFDRYNLHLFKFWTFTIFLLLLRTNIICGLLLSRHVLPALGTTELNSTLDKAMIHDVIGVDEGQFVCYLV